MLSFYFNNAFILMKIRENMDEERLKSAFGKVKEDMEGIKNELAFIVKRIAKIEDSLNKRALQEIKKEISKKKRKK